MSSDIPKEICDRITPFLEAHFGGGTAFNIAPIGDGLTNVNFLITLNQTKYILRVEGNSTAVLGIDRGNEIKVINHAHNLGFTPELFYHDLDKGLFLSQFIEGQTLTADLIKEGGRIEEIGGMIALFHSSGEIPGTFNGLQIVEEYKKNAEKKGLVLDDIAAESLKLSGLLQKLLVDNRQNVPCHNDMLATNFIDDGKKIWLIDWEYAGMGDLFFDLANFAVNQQLNQDEILQFLHAYKKNVTDSDYSNVMIMKVVSDLRESWWGYLQSTMSDLDFNYLEYAKKHAQRAVLTSRTADFKTWIKDISKEQT
jgi:thiamine kinase-like enzyme